MMKFSSKEEWRNYCYKTHKSYLKNAYFKRWIKEKKIDIFDCSKLGQEDINLITTTIKNALRLCGEGFKLNFHKKINLDFAINNWDIDGAKILKMVKKSRKKCNASIFLVDKKVKSGKNVLKFGDALTYVSDGITIFTFDPSMRYPKRFFKDAIAHEIYHLLGLNIHHNDTKVDAYKNLSRCVMEYNAPSEHLCNKCRDGLLSFWEGIKNAKPS